MLAYLGTTHSHPEWLVARWFDRHGFDASERWIRFNNETPRLTLRVNTLRAGVMTSTERGGSIGGQWKSGVGGLKGVPTKEPKNSILCGSL